MSQDQSSTPSLPERLQTAALSIEDEMGGCMQHDKWAEQLHSVTMSHAAWIEQAKLLREARMAIVAPSESGERKLDKPAQVGNTIFGVGVSERLVIERAQREHEYQRTPEKEAERLERVGEFRKALGVCPKCGTNRFQAPCPNGHMAETTGQCPMVGTAEEKL